MEELKNQANELINGNIDSYPALSREAAGKAILMLIEKAENLQEQLRLTQVDNNLLMTENARYREALEFTTDMLKASQIWVTSYGVRHDSEKAIQKTNEALKGGE